MHIDERRDGDREELARRIRQEGDAQQRDRYRSVLLAIDGEATLTIMSTLARSRGFVQRWAYAYRDHGLDAIAAKPRGGSQPKLDAAAQQRFIDRFQAGATDADDGRCTLRGRDAVRILADEFGVSYSLSGAYELLHRHNLVCLKPRPQHRHNDPQAMAQWLEDAPFLSSASANNTPTDVSKSGSRTKRGSANKGR
jgi:transposase